jgi:hypothetical protein
MGVEILLGDDGDCLVAFASPGERAGTMETATEYEDENCQPGAIQISTSIMAFRASCESTVMRDER